MTTQQFTRQAPTNGRVLADQSQLVAAMQAKLDALVAENAALKAAKGGPKALSWRVSQSGAVSVYGMGRFPVTLFANQWRKLAEVLPQILAFIDTNPTHWYKPDPDHADKVLVATKGDTGAYEVELSWKD